MTNFTCKGVLLGTLLPLALTAVAYAGGIRHLTASTTTQRTVVERTFDKQNRPLTRGIMTKGGLMKHSSVKRSPMKHGAPTSTVVDEDFSKFTAGTEDTPDETFINDANWNIPDTYTKQSGWTGFGVAQAGGTCALNYPDYGGVLNTPLGDYSGTVHVKFRLKALATNSYDNISINVGLCHDLDNALLIDDESAAAKKGEWTDYEFSFTCAYGGTDAFIQFNSYDYVVIDDVQVMRESNFLAEPTLLSPTNFTYDGFTANWKSVGGADQYLLTVYKQVPTSEEDSIDYSADFSELLADHMPDGWTYKGAAGSAPEFYQNTDSAVNSAILLHNGDTIQLPDNGGKLLSLTFSLLEALLPENLEEIDGCVYLEGWDGYKWHNEGYFYPSYYYGWGDKMRHSCDLTEDVAGNYTSFRLRVEDMPEGMTLGLTDVKWSTLSPTTNDYLFTNKVVDTTSYVLTGLDPNADYYYYVLAKNSKTDVVSNGPTQCQDAFGVAAPHIKPATDIDKRGGYTAQWEAAPKATSYSVENYDVYTAPAAIDSFVVLSENFDKLNGSSYTTESPYSFYNLSMASLDELTSRMGWYGFLCGYADGAIAGTGLSELNYGGQIQSPELTLSNNGGKFHVKITACGQYDSGEYLAVYTSKGNRGFYCPITKTYQTFESDITGGQMDDILVFETVNGSAFFITDIEVTQSLQPGDKVYELIGTAREEGNGSTSHRFSGLARKDNHSYAYAVYSIYERYFDTAWSDRSERQLVSLDGESSGMQMLQSDAMPAEVARYTIDGRRADSNAKGLMLVKYADGSVKKVMFK
jgi:hypothetical protein